MRDSAHKKPSGIIFIMLFVVMLLAGSGLFVAGLWYNQYVRETAPETVESVPGEEPVSAQMLLVAPTREDGVLMPDTVSDPCPPCTNAVRTTPSPESVVVYISGAVKHTGVYTVPHHARVDDVVRAAGGMTDEADGDRINLAAPVQDGEQVHVPRIGEPASQQDSAGTGGGMININTASVAELETLPGIGPVIAQRIVAYRDTHGPFSGIEDVQEVRGIGAALLADIETRITVGHP